MFQKTSLYFLILFLLVPTWLIGQVELGNPYVKNYNTKKHKISSTIWDITQDKNGLMYFGASSGVLQFDGNNWRTTKVDNESTVRSLDVDADGRVYVGAKGEFGYLSEDSLGISVYVSLSKNLDEKYKDFADVWNTYVTDEGVFFLSFQRIFQWHNNEFKVYEYDDITAHLGFYANKNLYLVRIKKGLHVFKNGDFVPVPGGEHYLNKTIFSVLPFDDNHVIVVTRNDGLEKLNIKTGVITPFINSANDELKENKVYHGAMSENGEYLIGTLNNGVYVIDKKGNLIMNVNQKNGLQSSNIKYLFKDFYGGIWAGTAMGISYIDLNLPLTFFNLESGIKGYSRDIIRHKGEIYLATGNGVYYLDTNEVNPKQKFKPVSGANAQFWSFIRIKNKLYVSANGVYEIENKTLNRKLSFGRDAVFKMAHSNKNPHIIYLALKNGLAYVSVDENGSITGLRKFEDFNDECHDLMEDKEGNLWVQTAYNYLIKVDAMSFNDGAKFTFTKFEQEEKIAAEEFINYNDEVLFSSKKGLLAYDKTQKFYQYSKLKLPLDLNYEVTRLTEDSKGNLWIHYHHVDGYSGELLAIKNKDGYQIKYDPFTRIKEKISHVRSPYVEDEVAWFLGGEGVIRYDFSNKELSQKNYKVNIRQIALNTDSVIDYGSSLIENPFVFNFKNNATAFSFSAATYSNEEEVYYQYLLEGYDEEWSDWTTQNNKEYNFLHEGKYTFKVRAKNVYNQISEEDHFSFEILPPWYRESWAYIVYVFLILIVIYAIIKIATYRLQQSKKQLELIVEARTKDIVTEKEIVEEQKLLIENVHAELSERNKDVMDSIKYAKRIQSSILPPIEKLKSEFKESFVLYKPRDIVSGDFYWFNTFGDFFIMACADCTGHGVPGAFMSMIGATLLNKIVEQENIDNCKDALNQLDIEIVKTLQQSSTSENQTAMDGMDVSLIAVNLKTNVCHYAGAYRPLYLIRDKELIIYKATRQSIGGGFNKKESFEGETIELKQGDLLYMFTDGVTDQFGGEKNKKYKTERLKQFLLNICEHNLEDQSKLINEEFEKWRGDNEQIDDVLITGIKIP